MDSVFYTGEGATETEMISVYGTELSTKYQSQIKQMFKLAVNVLLYISSRQDNHRLDFIKSKVPPLLSKKPKKMRRHMAEYGQKSKLDYCSVGDEIQVSLRKYERPSGEGISDHMTYSYRFMVRGHFRHYQTGAIKWIKPYYKGPDAAEIISKNYKVK